MFAIYIFDINIINLQTYNEAFSITSFKLQKKINSNNIHKLRNLKTDFKNKMFA